MTRHCCPVGGCRIIVPDHKPMCHADHMRVPAPLRRSLDAAWAAYRNLSPSASLELRAARRADLRTALAAAVGAVEAKLAAAAGA